MKNWLDEEGFKVSRALIRIVSIEWWDKKIDIGKGSAVTSR